ncbi:hypothetical protein OAR30_03445 [Euryarchaeota archaeon]|nr:hypothetical protein [Euryarchaeota archaeon]
MQDIGIKLTESFLNNDFQHSIMHEIKWRKRDILIFFLLVLAPMILETMIFFSGIIAAIFSVLLAKFFMKLIFILLPYYGRRQSTKGRFLIRFKNPVTEVSMNRKKKARIALSHAWVPFAFCVFIASTLITIQGFEGLATGEGIEFYKCANGQEILFEEIGSDFGCDDKSDLSDLNPFSCSYPECVGDPIDRVSEMIFDGDLLIWVLLSPLVAFLTAPLLIVRESTIAVVDKETRSIVPIGANAYRMLNAVFGFGAFIILTETSWSVAKATSDTLGGRIEVLMFMLFVVFSIMLLLFHVLWVYSYLYVKTHIKLLSKFETKLTNSEDIELHTFSETEPGVLSIEYNTN